MNDHGEVIILIDYTLHFKQGAIYISGTGDMLR